MPFLLSTGFPRLDHSWCHYHCRLSSFMSLELLICWLLVLCSLLLLFCFSVFWFFILKLKIASHTRLASLQKITSRHIILSWTLVIIICKAWALTSISSIPAYVVGLLFFSYVESTALCVPTQQVLLLNLKAYLSSKALFLAQMSGWCPCCSCTCRFGVTGIASSDAGEAVEGNVGVKSSVCSDTRSSPMHTVQSSST